LKECITCIFNLGGGVVEIRDVKDNKLFDWNVRYISIYNFLMQLKCYWLTNILKLKLKDIFLR